MPDLSEVKVGDTLLYNGKFGRRVAVSVAKVTPTMIVTQDGVRYHKKDGCPVSRSDAWNGGYLSAPTERDLQRIKIEALRNRLRNTDWSTVDDDTVVRVWGALKGGAE